MFRAGVHPWRRWGLDGLLGLVLPLAVGLSQAPVWQARPADIYTWAASELRAGRFRPQLYDDAYTLQAVADYTHGRTHDIFSPTPPTLAVFLVPLLWLPPVALPVVWLGLDILAPLLAVWLTLKAVDLPSLPLAGVCASLVLLSAPMWENNARGQVLHWQMLLFGLALYGLARGRQWLAGASLGLVFLLKLAGWPAWLVLAQRGRWRSLAWLGATAAAVVLLSLPWVTLDTWRYYLTSVLPRWVQAPIAAVPAYQTVGGFWQHLFRFDPSSNPAPVADLPGLAAVLSISTTLVLLGLTLFGLRRAPLLLAVSAGLVLTIVLAPIAEQYHYLTAVLALIVAGAEWHRLGHRPGLGLLLLLAGALILLPIPYKDPRLAAGWLALLAYPRLWGGLLVWGGLYTLARSVPEPARQWRAVEQAA